MMQENPCLLEISSPNLDEIKVAIKTTYSQYWYTFLLFAIKLFYSLKSAKSNVKNWIRLASLIASRCYCGLHMPSESADG